MSYEGTVIPVVLIIALISDYIDAGQVEIWISVMNFILVFTKYTRLCSGWEEIITFHVPLVHNCFPRQPELVLSYSLQKN